MLHRAGFVRLMCAVLVAAMAVSGCTSVRSGHGTPGPSSAPTPAASPSPDPPEFAPPRAAASDGETQYLAGLAEYGHVLVAVGADHSGGVWRAMFVRSVDDGRTWRRASVAADPGATVDDTADLVVHRDGEFLAVGAASGAVSVWTSPDGSRWTRHAVPSSMIGPDDEVVDVTSTAAGLVAVGDTSVAGRRDLPAAWTSRDGRHWTKRSGTPAGLVGTVGADVDLGGVAAAGGSRRIVAVGSVESRDGDRDRPAVWRSGDAGVHWSRVSLPADLAGSNSRDWLDSIRWSGGRFVATGSGGSQSAGGYSGVIATSADGRQWRASFRGQGLVAAGQVFLTSAVTRAGQVSAYGARCARACVLHGVAQAGSGWRTVSLPVRGEGDEMDVKGAVTTSTGAIVLVGFASPHGDADARIWRSPDGVGFDRVELKSVGAASRPTVYTGAIARGGGTYRVVGSGAGLPVVWASKDGRTFDAPSVLSHDPAVSATGITYGSRGWLITGSRRVGDNEQALVWTSPDGMRWTRSAGGVFGAANAFAYSSIAAATSFRGWVVVGETSDNGAPNASALAYRSADGGSWSGGDLSTRRVVRTSRTTFDAVYDLRGGIHGRRVMSDVAVGRSGLAAVGYGQHENAEPGEHPAYWSSTDARSWRLHWLPEPHGVASAYVWAVATKGSTIVGTGSEDRGTKSSACVWTSTDDGHTWQLGHLPGASGARYSIDASTVLATADGFVALGSAGPSGAARPRLWRSPDGLSWTAVAFTDRRTSQPGDWAIVGAVRHGHTLVGLASTRTTAGLTSFTFTQRV